MNLLFGKDFLKELITLSSLIIVINKPNLLTNLLLVLSKYAFPILLATFRIV